MLFPVPVRGEAERRAQYAITYLVGYRLALAEPYMTWYMADSAVLFHGSRGLRTGFEATLVYFRVR